MKNKSMLQNTLEYIDHNLDTPLSLQLLANRCGYSSYHFSRVFSWGLGVSTMDYVNQRRMHYACYYLSQGMRILDIAVSLGFETHSGFSKSFKKTFKTTPENYRRHASAVVPPLPSLDLLEHYTLGGIIMNPRIIEQEAIKLVGYKITTTNQDQKNSKDIPAMWQAYFKSGNNDRLHQESFITSHNEFGVCLPFRELSQSFEYMIGVALNGDADITGYETDTIPAGTFAVFTVPTSPNQAFPDSIQSTWNYIFNEWFPTSGYEFDDSTYDYEFYPVSSIDDTSEKCDIYLPIKKV